MGYRGSKGISWGVGVFRGESELNMDAKGRIAVPSRYRERLMDSCSGKLVITLGLGNPCLAVYPMPHWQGIEEQLQKMPATDQKAGALVHLLIGHAAEADMDSNGRILIPGTLRRHAKLDKRVSMVGQIHKFELWDEAAWTAGRDEMLGQLNGLLNEPSEAISSLVL